MRFWLSTASNFSVERMAGPACAWQFGSRDRASHRSPFRWMRSAK
jgi:hypothetical protein